nr:glycosyltransferase [Alcaligenes sp. HPC1271]
MTSQSQSLVSGVRTMVMGNVSGKENPEAGETTGWGCENWIAGRTPTAARIFALKSILAAQTSPCRVGILIVADEQSSQEQVSRTLHSVQSQCFSASCIWLASSGDQHPDGDTAAIGLEILDPKVSWQEAFNRRLSQAIDLDWVWILHAGDELFAHALLQMQVSILQNTQAMAWYVDEAFQREGQTLNVLLKPDFSVDLFRSYPYTGRSCVLSVTAWRTLGGLQEGLGEVATLDWLWRLVEHAGPPAIGHVQEVLLHSPQSLLDWCSQDLISQKVKLLTELHLERMGINGTVEPTATQGVWRVDYALAQRPMVSVILPLGNSLPLIKHCLEGLVKHTAYDNLEIILAKSASSDPKLSLFLTDLVQGATDLIKVVECSPNAGLAGFSNVAVQQAKGEVLLFLSDESPLPRRHERIG